MADTRKETSPYYYLEYLRVISALAVIIIHVSGENWFRVDLGSFNWVVQTFFNIGGRFSVCVFAMISGALLLRPGKEISTHDLFFRYIKRILIIYLVWTLLYALLYTFINQGDASYFVSRLFHLPDHLWYLVMLIGLYLAYPVVRLITKNRQVTLYMIWLCVITGAFTLIQGTTGFFSELAGDNYFFDLWNGLLDNLGEMKSFFVPGYLGLFLMGHYIHEYGLGKWHKRIVNSAIPALILSSLLTILISLVTGRRVYTFMLETNPLVILASAGIFAYFRGAGDTPAQQAPQTPLAKAALQVAGYTFGIYLIHFAVRVVFTNCLGFSVASYPAILSVPVNSLLIFVISLVLTAVLKMIPFVRTILT